MLWILSFTLLLTMGSSFMLKSNPRHHINSRLHMSSLATFDPADLPGALPPVGFFDPLGLSVGKTEKEIQRWRESELKHGRICMLAALGIPFQENFHPLFQGRIEGPAIFHFQEIENLIPPFWYVSLFAIAIIEGYGITKGWESPSETPPSRTAMLKDGYVPGDLGFDPLGLNPSRSKSTERFGQYSTEFADIRSKELSNGRLAMLAVAGYVAQEVIDLRTILQHYQEFGFGRGTPFT